MTNFSIVIPIYPPHFKYLSRIIDQINEFNLNENDNIVEVILSASSTDPSAVSDLTNTTKKCIYNVIILDTIQWCNAATNRNRGWEIASGKWIVFLDADDIYHQDKIAICSRYIKDDICCILHSYIYKTDRNLEINKNNWTINDVKVISNSEISECTSLYDESTLIAHSLLVNLPVHHGISTVRKDVPIRFKNINTGEDCLFCREICFYTKGLLIISAPLMIYFGYY